MPVLDARVRDILADAELSDGRFLRLPGHLSRDDYSAVNKVLQALGGTWSRTDKAHVFAQDPSAALATVLDSGEVPKPARTREGYVPTPPELAALVVREHTDIAALDAPLVLEPSAGAGNLVTAVLAANPRASVIAVEPNADRAAPLRSWPAVALVTCTFEEYLATLSEPRDVVDAVVMNPPFAVLGHPTIWIDHVHAAWDLVRPGGRLTAIVPAGYVFRTDRRHTELRDLIAPVGGHLELPDTAFGTGIRTVLLRADKPRGYVKPEPPRRRGKYTATPEERAERAEADRELREHGEELLKDPATVDRITATLTANGASAKVLGYSPRNQALLLAQCEARGIRLVDVDTVNGWRTRGRKVRRGVVGLRIVAPMGSDDRADTATKPPEEPAPVDTTPAAVGDTDTNVLFRMLSVFEQSQTDPATTAKDRVH